MGGIGSVPIKARVLMKSRLLSQLATNCSLGDRVHFLGWVDDVICPSIWEEPYGSVAVVAKSIGIPSISSPSGGLAELIEHGANGWITGSKTAGELSDALEHYLLNREIAGDHGRNAQRSLYSLRLDSFFERWLSIYRRVLPSHCGN